MWGVYREIGYKFKRISIDEERKLIAKAKKGVVDSTNEIVLRHLGFVIFRLHKKVAPQYLRRYGSDFLSASIPVLYQKINSYDLGYKNRAGKRRKVKFTSYIWKRIDGFIVDSIKRELAREKMESTLALDTKLEHS